MYPAPVYQPQQQQQVGSTIPWWVWMGAGFLAANVARMVSGTTHAAYEWYSPQ
jgi:hypothetical protein